ncbi:response regulator [bacterium]|nr:MAG: response regulator [bacterium]
MVNRRPSALVRNQPTAGSKLATMHKVLLVEDDPTMLNLLDTLFKIEGFAVARCDGSDLDVLLDLARHEAPDAALLDVHLKRMNGLEALRRIRQDPQLYKVKVVMTSGLDKRTESLAAGADDFIQKPFMPEQLVNIIRKRLLS